MGLNKAHVFALAMALSLAVTAIAGILLGVRTSFDPAIGGGRLIFGFEAVIIGGLGKSLGHARRRCHPRGSPDAGCQDQSGLAVTGGARCLPAGACDPAQWPVSEGRALNGVTVTRTSGVARTSLLLTAVAILFLAAAPWWAGRADMRLMACEIFLYLSLASLWNLMAGIRRSRFGWPAGVCRIRGLHAVRPDAIRRISPGHGNFPGRNPGGCALGPGCDPDLQAERRVFRHRHMGHCRGVPPRDLPRSPRSAADPDRRSRSALSGRLPTPDPDERH